MLKQSGINIYNNEMFIWEIYVYTGWCNILINEIIFVCGDGKICRINLKYSSCVN